MASIIHLEVVLSTLLITAYDCTVVHEAPNLLKVVYDKTSKDVEHHHPHKSKPTAGEEMLHRKEEILSAVIERLLSNIQAKELGLNFTDLPEDERPPTIRQILMHEIPTDYSNVIDGGRGVIATRAYCQRQQLWQDNCAVRRRRKIITLNVKYE